MITKSPKPKPYAKPVLLQHGNLGSNENQSLRAGLDGAASSKNPAIGWGVIALLVGLLWWWVYRHWRHPFTWLAGLLPFIPVLIAFYYYLEQALPAGY